MKALIYISILTSSIGASIISIDLGFFQLSLFRTILLLLMALMIINTLLRNGSIKVISKKENSFSIKFMLFWLIYAVLSLAWVKDFEGWFRAVYFLMLGVLSVIIYSKFLKERRNIIKAFEMMSIMVIFHNIIGWYEIFSGNYLFLNDSQSYYAKFSYPVSMFDNTNNFALFMLASIFISYICGSNTKIKSLKVVYILLMISSTYLLIMTNSRATILGTIMAYGFFVFMSVKNRSTRNAIFFLLLPLFLINLFKPSIISDFLNLMNQNLYFRFSDNTGSEFIRSNLIKNGFVFLFSTLGFGTGAGNIEYWMSNYGTYFTGNITSMHNWWMEILTGYGILIFILYLIFYFKLFRSLYWINKNLKDRQNITISLGIMSFMVGFILGSISSSSNIGTEWLWVLFGVIIAYQGSFQKIS